MTTPFIIYGLARSRTAWLAKFLSYREWNCHHEQAIYMRSMDDVRNLLSQPNTGCVETAVAMGRPLIKHAFPDIKEVVVLRPIEDVINSMARLYDDNGLKYDPEKLIYYMERGDTALRKIACDSSVLTINFSDLDFPGTCASIFEHCLPYKFDYEWWVSLKNENIQVDINNLVEYYQKNRDAVDEFKTHCKIELFKLFRAGEIKREMNYAIN